MNLSVKFKRYKVCALRSNAVFLTVNNGVSHTVAALIFIKRSAHWSESGRPDGIAVFYVEILSAVIHRNVIIAETCDTTKACIFIKAVTACCVGYQCEKCFVSEVVDPRIRCVWGFDDILFSTVIKMSEFHIFLPFLSELRYFGL